MKAAFKIIPEEEQNNDTHLLIEAGAESISFLLYSKSPFKINGLYLYNLDKNLLPAEIAAEINDGINNEPLLQQSFPSCTVCYNFKESLLQPQQYFNEEAQEEMLQLFFGSSNSAIIYCDKMPEQKIANVYRVEEIITQVLQEFFAEAAYFHSSTLQLKKLPEQDNTLSCIVYHSAIKIILYKENKLQLVQYFSYSIAMDVAYHLLNVCTQHGIAATEINILLSGMIDEKSNLYNEIYKYFLNVQFDKLPADITLSEGILNYPPHFFSRLISLASCVS